MHLGSVLGYVRCMQGVSIGLCYDADVRRRPLPRGAERDERGASEAIRFQRRWPQHVEHLGEVVKVWRQKAGGLILSAVERLPGAIVPEIRRVPDVTLQRWKHLVRVPGYASERRFSLVRMASNTAAAAEPPR